MMFILTEILTEIQSKARLQNAPMLCQATTEILMEIQCAFDMIKKNFRWNAQIVSSRPAKSDLNFVPKQKQIPCQTPGVDYNICKAFT